MDIDSTTIQAILQAAHRVRPTRVEKPGEIKPFDFHVPHRFTSEHTKKLRDVSDVLARGLTATLSATLQGAFPIALGDIKEMYVSLQDTPAGAYYVPLNFNRQLAGYLLLPRDTAIGWVTKMLGGLADAEVAEGRTLSTLENDLLLDIVSKIVATLSRVSKENDGPEVTHTPTVSSLLIELVEEGQIADLCSITFRRNEGEKALPFSVVALSDILEPIAGVVHPPERSREEVHQDMLTHVKSVHMKVDVRLGTVHVSMRDLVSLESGDVILLQRPVDEPIDVIVSGKTVMSGQPVQHHGWYGLQIMQVKEE